MTLSQANDILQNPKKYYSHHKDDATEFCRNAVKFIYENRDNPIYEAIIDSINIHLNHGNNDTICGNCKWFDPVGHCQRPTAHGEKVFVSPAEDASLCRFYSPYKKEG